MFNRYIFPIFLVLSLYSSPTFTHTIKQTFEYKQKQILEPTSVQDLKKIIAKAQSESVKIAIVGKNKSMGGQTVSHADRTYRISLNKLNNLIDLNIPKQTITVQTGMTWQELQQIIAPYGLAVRAMQSYNDFSIGGSLGVNVHGQDIHDAPLIKTVVSFNLLCANGEVIKVSRSENANLFGLAIGGYGLFGVITQVTLKLTSDTILKRYSTTLKSHKLAHHITSNVTKNKNVDFFSGRFSVGPSNLLEEVMVIEYHHIKNTVDKSFEKSSAYKYLWSRVLLGATKFSQKLKDWRFYFEKKYLKKDTLTTRNNFQNISIVTLPQWSLYILQEYFIPYEHLDAFTRAMKTVLQEHNVNIINVSARHVPQDNESTLNFAKKDCCALVLYINIDKDITGYSKCMQWTDKLINQALKYDGTFYLPYHILASDTQILKSYPQLPEFIKKKKLYDPKELFSNALYERYAHLGN